MAKRNSIGYDIDGLVVRIDDIKKFEELGDLNMNPRGAIAYKPPAEAKTTTIKEVAWQMGRQGHVTPVAILEPIDIGGVTITRVSLHTARNAISLGSGTGSVVSVSRANEVIPFLKAVIKKTTVKAPEKCPGCNQKLIWEGEYLACVNHECPYVLVNSIMNWVDRHNILNWGESLVNTLINKGLVHTLPDIYDLDWGMVGDAVGHGVAERARLSFENSGRHMNLTQFIMGLGIKSCHTTAKDIVGAGYDTVDKFLSLDEATLSGISGIGPVKAASIASGIKQLEKTVRELIKHVTIEAPKVGKLTGKSVCFTGSAKRSRKELQAMAEGAGLEVKDSVTKGLTYLVLADPSSTSSKSEKARKLGTQCISEEEFSNMVE